MEAGGGAVRVLVRGIGEAIGLVEDDGTVAGHEDGAGEFAASGEGLDDGREPRGLRRIGDSRRNQERPHGKRQAEERLAHGPNAPWRRGSRRWPWSPRRSVPCRRRISPCLGCYRS